MDRRVGRGSLVGPLILIGLGVIFLLNSLGMLPWSVWDVVLRLWPVLLIAWGLDLLIGRRSICGSLVDLVLIVGVVLGGMWLSWNRTGTGGGLIASEVVQPLSGATRAQVKIEPALGRLGVGALTASDNLVEGQVYLSRGEDLARQFSVEGGMASFEVKGEGAWFTPFAGMQRRGWELDLNPEVPLELGVDLGVGEARLDLSDLKIERLNVDLGLGRIEVVLPEEGRLRAVLDCGIGETVVIIPAGMEARIAVDTGLAGREIPPGYQSQDDIYTSPGYEGAENRVDLEVSQSIGMLRISGAG
jgi:hypothetical protein